MASLTITLKTQRVNVLGPAPSSKWSDSLVWGSVGWGEKVIGAGNVPVLLTTVIKFMTWSGVNTVSPTMAAIGGLSFGLAKTWTKANTCTVFYANSDKEILDGRGYNYVFIDRTVNAESAATCSYSSQAVAPQTYTSLAAASTVWS